MRDLLTQARSELRHEPIEKHGQRRERPAGPIAAALRDEFGV
jgi:hypothetical protein